ncbi:hypothetical protein ALC62_02256 [Cyphomyrmex costatus]|uniref:DUF7041 domain-containing protein n=1 Tax=Cyphomyrmex costatus TaxID=456900 RepID=A0A151INI0_9HYME|nr:hypothetical protein ALC62_02256 [Cyphomyrmex costatus]
MVEQQRVQLEQQRRQLEQERRELEQQRREWAQRPAASGLQTGMELQPNLFVPGAEVSRVGMRMPEFTPADPELWFSIVDRSFLAAGITVDATKFGYALTAIGPRYTMEVRDVIMNPPAERAYETLKTELIKRLNLSQEHKTRRLLEHEEIGDRKPSQFLRHLRGLAGNVVGDKVLRTIWLSRLPSYIQPHLVTRAEDTVDQLTDIADAIVEATRAPAFQEIAEQLSAIRTSIESIRDVGRGRDRGRDRGERAWRSRSRPRSRSRNRGHAPGGPCYYHWRFGTEATRCEPPCSMQQVENTPALR